MGVSHPIVTIDAKLARWLVGLRFAYVGCHKLAINFVVFSQPFSACQKERKKKKVRRSTTDGNHAIFVQLCKPQSLPPLPLPFQNKQRDNALQTTSQTPSSGAHSTAEGSRSITSTVASPEIDDIARKGTTA